MSGTGLTRLRFRRQESALKGKVEEGLLPDDRGYRRIGLELICQLRLYCAEDVRGSRDLQSL